MTDKWNSTDIAHFQEQLLEWYDHNQRVLPWRENQDPYRIWVSEVMLQQTKVDTVIPYFNNFMEKFPSIKDLAEAEEEKVLKAWEGLGYYSRVRNLQHAVKEVHEKYEGRVPSDPKLFSSLKGVGPYTAGAVMSIAYELPEPAVDGNVMRVFSRLLCIEEDIGKAKTRKTFEAALPPFLENVPPSQFNQAVMELGAMICTPRSPGCLLCPVQEFCEARMQGKEQILPIKEKKKAAKAREMAAVVLKSPDGRFLFHQREEKGLLAKMWEFPNAGTKQEEPQAEQVQVFIEEHIGMEAVNIEPVQYVEHAFSHLIWNITVYEAETKDNDVTIPEEGHWKWMTLKEAEAYAFPVSHQKILHQQQGEGKQDGSGA